MSMLLRLSSAVLVTASLLTLTTAGCTGNPSSDGSDTSGHDLDSGDCTSGCDTAGQQMAKFVGPPVNFDGAEEATITNLEATDGPKYSVQTGDEEEVQATTYTAKFGDQTLASNASDGLPLITLANGWLAISPPVTDIVVEVGDEPTEPDAPSVNLFIQGTWTCQEDGDGWHDTQTAVYKGGNTLTLPDLYEVKVTGMDINYEQDGDIVTGTFESDGVLHASVHYIASGDHTLDCWVGTMANKP